MRCRLFGARPLPSLNADLVSIKTQGTNLVEIWIYLFICLSFIFHNMFINPNGNTLYNRQSNGYRYNLKSNNVSFLLDESNEWIIHWRRNHQSDPYFVESSWHKYNSYANQKLRLTYQTGFITL